MPTMPSWVPGRVSPYDVLSQLYEFRILTRAGQHVGVFAVRHGGDPNV